MPRLFCLFLTAAILQSTLPVRAAEPQAGLGDIVTAMESEIAANHAAGVVTMVVRDGKTIHHAATGLSDIDRQRPMQLDSIFWIASMTKSVSSTTIMTLVDEGKLSLDEPASKWMPEVGQVKLADGKAPSRPLTLRDLMSHTSGLAFPKRKANDGAHSLRSYSIELLKAPLAFEPGSNYEYGFGITVAGRIAEIVSGKPFENLVQERIIGPLKMNDTSFQPNQAQRQRIASSYKTMDGSKKLVRTHNPFVTADEDERRMVEPSGGLFSTAKDMSVFYQMILNGGIHEGKQVVSQDSIDQMTKAHAASGRFNYGLGWQCSGNDRPGVIGYSNRSFGHGGAYGTHGWVDPESKTISIFMVQNAMVTDGNKMRNAFHAAVTGVAGSSSE